MQRHVETPGRQESLALLHSLVDHGLEEVSTLVITTRVPFVPWFTMPGGG